MKIKKEKNNEYKNNGNTKRTKNNQKEIENIMELKTMYALEISEFNKEKNFADALKNIAKRYT